MNTKTWLAAVGCACTLAASGMPTQAELEKVQGLVTELMRSDVANFNERKMSAADVATAALKYAGEAQSEAARFLLLKGAFFYRVRAEDYDGAMDVISKIRHDINDVPDTTLVKILSGAVRRIPRKSAGRLYDLHHRLQNRVRYAQEAKDLTAKVKTKPSDKSLRTALGERYALLGEWDKALPEFAAGKGRVAKAATLEQTAGAKPGDVADAWWEVAGTEDSDISFAYRAHAVRFYRAALADGSLSGLKKPIAAKRIEEVKTDGFVDELAGAFSAARGSGDLYCVIDLSAGPNARKYPVSYLDAEPKGGWTDEYKTTKLVLRRIEPGKFMMVGKYEVTLTKPFYCGVFEVTQKQYELVTGTNPSFYRGDMRPVEMVPWNVFRGNSATYNWPSSVNVDPSTFIGKIQVRTGLNFDLPTEAQWEYACRAGTTSKFNNGCDSESDLKKLGRFMLNQKERSFNDDNESFAKHEPDGKGGYSGGHTVVGSYMPNAWGLYDMHGNVWEWCLDWRDRRDKGLILSSGVTDPVGPSSGAFRVMRGGCWDSRAAACTSFTRNHANPVWVRHVVGFRLVMVSDLLKERGIKPLESSDKAAGSK